jgi:hypothetical protein
MIGVGPKMYKARRCNIYIDLTQDSFLSVKLLVQNIMPYNLYVC